MGRVLLRSHRLPVFWQVVVVAGLISSAGSRATAAEPATVEGTLTANGTSVALPYVYAYALEEGFYDASDPSWKLIFVERPIEERKLKEHIWDAAYVQLEITRTTEFGDEPELRVYSQDVRLSAEAGGNLSGGEYPTLELESIGPDGLAGRVYHAEAQEFFDDTYQYDFTFRAPLSDPNAPIGEALPADGGEPGKAYLAWVTALHSGDPQQLKPLVPPELAEQLDAEGAKEEIEMMASFTPTAVKILGGSSDGETAILDVEGTMDGEPVRGKVTLQKTDGFWMATESSW